MNGGPLRLRAEDEADLAVISAALQDAVGKVGDIVWDSVARTLTLAVNRYRWEAGDKSGAKSNQRVRSGLQLGDVRSVKARNIRREAKGAVLELLSIAFEPGEAPTGVVVFTFAGGGDLRAEVECLDVVLADLSPAWPTRVKPDHG